MEVASILINKMLSEAVNRGTTSLHLSVGSQPMVRVDCELVLLEGENIIDQELMNSIINFVSDEEGIAKLNTDKEIVLVKEFSGGVRARVNIFYQKGSLIIM